MNQDNFLVATLHKRIDVKFSSLDQGNDNVAPDERLAFIMMVADGVGGTEHGEAASRLTVESVSKYVSEAMRCYYGARGRRDICSPKSSSRPPGSATRTSASTPRSRPSGAWPPP